MSQISQLNQCIKKTPSDFSAWTWYDGKVFCCNKCFNAYKKLKLEQVKEENRERRHRDRQSDRQQEEWNRERRHRDRQNRRY